jgi:N-formylglutamate amidohydrolase
MDLPVADPEHPPSAPVLLVRPEAQSAPLVFASPHSGRLYPPAFIAAARLDALGLRRSEDSFVDALFEAAPAHGAPLLAATFPRAFCDPNREPWELDPGMFADDLPPWVNTTSARVGAGLGTIARVVASGETIYRAKLPFAEAERRVRACWEPFHDALFSLIAETRRRFGACLLIDCHSMPAHGNPGRNGVPAADFVLGDAHGTACSPWWSRCLGIWATRCGATTLMPAATSPAITAARARASMSCRSRSPADCTWTRPASNGCPGSTRCNAT